MVSGAGEGNRTLLPSVSFRRKACRYAISRLNRLLVSAQYVTVFSTLSRQSGNYCCCLCFYFCRLWLIECANLVEQNSIHDTGNL